MQKEELKTGQLHEEEVDESLQDGNVGVDDSEEEEDSMVNELTGDNVSSLDQ